MENFATNFTEEMIPKINEVLKFVLDNPHSDFYRKKYGSQNVYPIKSYEDFQKIPFLTKDEILATPLAGRIFVPESDLSYFSFSSGTTNSKKPTVLPHASFDRASNKNPAMKDLPEKLGVRRLMLLKNVLSPGFFKNIRRKFKSHMLIPGDIHNLPITASIAKELNIDAFNTSPTVLYYFIPHLRTAGFDFSSVKMINLGGEFCSSQRVSYFKDIFPNSFFVFRYANSETDVRGYRCENLAGTPPNAFHINSDAVMEIIDDQHKSSSLDSEGKIAHTALEIGAFPLIRYMTGDIGKISATQCPCGENSILSLGGRAGTDILKFQGITLNAHLIDKALENIQEYIEPLFEMHVFEEKTGDAIKPKLQLHICLKEKYKNKSVDPYFVEIIKEKISKNLSLSSTNTLKSLAEQGIFMPLEIIFIETWSEKKSKQRPIISHFE